MDARMDPASRGPIPAFAHADDSIGKHSLPEVKHKEEIVINHEMLVGGVFLAEPIKLKQGHWKRANTKGCDEYLLRLSTKERHFSAVLPPMVHSKRCIYCSVQVNERKVMRKRTADGMEKDITRYVTKETRQSETRYFCQTCGVMLCIRPYSGVAGTPTCHELYHSQEMLERPAMHRSDIAEAPVVEEGGGGGGKEEVASHSNEVVVTPVPAPQHSTM